MAMKRYFTFFKVPELEPHHQMVFVIFGTCISSSYPVGIFYSSYQLGYKGRGNKMIVSYLVFTLVIFLTEVTKN